MTGTEELLAAASHDVDRGRVPACQLAVARDGQLVLFETLGKATDTTRFCVFSCTKAIVSSAVWLLLAEGSLDLSAPVTDYVPELFGLGQGVTVEQVMLHTSGFPNAPMAPTEGADPVGRRKRFETWRLDWEPGTRFEYHGQSAHWVLADLLERLGGRDFRDFVHERVTRPLGLPRVLGIPADEQHDIAELVADGGAELLAHNDPAVRAAGVPASGGIMTAADLALFYQALLHNPGKLWRADWLAEGTGAIRCRFADPILGVPVNRTIGLVVAGDDGQHAMRYASFGEGNSARAFGHAGAHGQIGWADPDTGVSFAYVTSGVGSDPMREGRRAYLLSTAASSLFRD